MLRLEAVLHKETQINLQADSQIESLKRENKQLKMEI